MPRGRCCCSGLSRLDQTSLRTIVDAVTKARPTLLAKPHSPPHFRCNMMTFLHHALWLGMLALPPVSSAQSQAHQHGVLEIDIAVEARKLTLQMESPLDNLVGFERAPRNDVERKRVEGALAKLRAAHSLFVIDPAAQCKVTSVTLTSAVLKLGALHPAGASAKVDHADIDASFEFECQDATRAAFIDIGLFDVFAEMKSIEVQVVTDKGQFKRTLKRPAHRVALTR